MADDPLPRMWRLLRFLLKTTKLEEWEHFHYAEAHIYTEPDRWTPLLLGDAFDINSVGVKALAVWVAGNPTSKLDWYTPFLNYTSSLKFSLLHTLEDQFSSPGSDAENGRPVVAILMDSAESSKKAAKAAQKIVPWFRFLPEARTNMHDFEEYRKWASEFSVNLKRGAQKPYPSSALVVGLPILRSEGGRLQLLANLILILEAKPANGEKGTAALDKAYLIDLYDRLQGVQRAAAWELANRFAAHIDGFYPTDDPIVRIAHPALTKAAHRAAVAREGKDHGGLPVSFGKPGRKESPVLYLERALRRTCKKEDRDKSQFDAWLRGDDSAVLSADDRSFAGNWLKFLYCHQQSQARFPFAPNSNYNIAAKCVEKYLVPLLQDAAKADHDAETTFEVKAQVFGDVESGTFRWPVIPGVRVLIPWLDLVRFLTQLPLTSNAVLEATEMVLGVLVKGKKGPVGKGFNSLPIGMWLGRFASPRDGEEESNRCGLLAQATYTGKQLKAEQLRQAVIGWQGALMDQYRRRGGSTSPFAALLAGDCGTPIRARRLPIEELSDLFRPLEGSPGIRLDLEAASGSPPKLLVAASWEVR